MIFIKSKMFFLVVTLIVVLSGCSRGFDYVYIKNKSFEKKYEELINRYSRYWECMSKKDFKCSYKYEMPYQRFLHDYKWYVDFNKDNKKSYKTILLDIISENKNRVLVKSEFVSADNKVTYVFYDTWYNVNGTWYHKMKVSLLPFGGGKED